MKTAVVVPVYNQEAYLNRAFDSLVNQTLGDFVVVAVNDGSTDGSPKIMRDYESRYPGRFVIVDKANAGVSSARNAALDRVETMEEVDSITFLDPDDFFHVQAIEIMRRFWLENPTRVLSWGCEQSDAETFSSTRYDASNLTSVADSRPRSVCLSIYPKSALSGIRFFEKSNIAEDIAFNMRAEYLNKLEYRRVNALLTYYFQNPTSTMHKRLELSDFEKRLEILEHMVAIYAGDEKALSDLAGGELAVQLKQFYRDLKRRTEKASFEECVALFRSELKSLRHRSLLRRNRARFKDIKYFVRLYLMSW